MTTVGNVRLGTVSDAAKFLDIEPDTVYRWVKAGYLPCIRLGVEGSRRVLRFDLDALRRWVEGQTRAGGP